MKKIKIALILNSVIFALFSLGAFFTFFGVKLTGDDGTSSGIDALKYYTVLSNIFMGLVSGAAVIYEYLILKGKRKDVPIMLTVIKLSATVGVCLTFIIVMIYLAPFNPDGFFSMFTNSNLFFHFMIPVLSIIVFVFYEKADIKFHSTFISVIPTLLYGIFYAITAFTHTADGVIIPEYDWYRFFYGGTIAAIGFYVFILGLSFFVSFLLWKLNRKYAK